MSGAVSVVIPARNAAKFLAEAVASVRAQTHPVAEIVVVDDGSTDATVAVAQALGREVRVISQPPAGAAQARNRGAEAATGEWLAFLDADDLWHPEKLARQFAWLAAQPGTEAVFVHGANFRIGPEGGRQEEPPRPACLPGAVLLRRDFFLREARFPSGVAPSEVVAWYLRLEERGTRIGVVPELLFWRRLHADNTRRLEDGGRAMDLRLLRERIAAKRSGRRAGL